VADQLARRGDAHPAAQRALAAVAGDAGRLAVLGHEQLQAQQLLDLVDEIFRRADRRAGGVDLGEHAIERGDRGRLLQLCGGGQQHVARCEDLVSAQPLADQLPQLRVVERDVGPLRARCLEHALPC